jgi:hypothetical protein
MRRREFIVGLGGAGEYLAEMTPVLKSSSTAAELVIHSDGSLGHVSGRQMRWPSRRGGCPTVRCVRR